MLSVCQYMYTVLTTFDWLTAFKKEQKGKKEAAAESKRRKSELQSSEDSAPEAKKQKTDDSNEDIKENDDSIDDSWYFITLRNCHQSTDQPTYCNYSSWNIEKWLSLYKVLLRLLI